MENRFSRTELLIGKESLDKLKKSKVIVFGLGGVGSFVIEALARSGVGSISLVDSDKVDITNINRQLIADDTTVGKFKTQVMKERLFNINPDLKVTTYNTFVSKENIDQFDFLHYNYVVDAIDTVTSKLLIVQKAYENKVDIISSMGTANKIDPLMLRVDDIYKTHECPLARVMRRELKKRFVKHLKVVYSIEKPVYTARDHDINGKKINASVSFVPSVAGLIIGGQVIRDILKQN
ncbi:MAG: tRNA threonylcarbamoyladenosine dehydratase [Clostridia bacterium]|nr:tRNA threonylcarbamoyladenosine dehydratase [Clostridia bacterium]